MALGFASQEAACGGKRLGFASQQAACGGKRLAGLAMGAAG